MKTYTIVTALATLLAIPVHAATTISTTLTMTSPSAIISMTGISSTAYLRNISSTNVSTTLLTLANVDISASLIPIASAYISTTASTCTVLSASNISSCTRFTTGSVGVSFTTPRPNATYKANCNIDGGFPASWASNTTLSNNTGGFYVGFLNGSGATAYQDSHRAMCVVLP